MRKGERCRMISVVVGLSIVLFILDCLRISLCCLLLLDGFCDARRKCDALVGLVLLGFIRKVKEI
jgi:hypothetical protein